MVLGCLDNNILYSATLVGVNFGESLFTHQILPSNLTRHMHMHSKMSILKYFHWIFKPANEDLPDPNVSLSTEVLSSVIAKANSLVSLAVLT